MGTLFHYGLVIHDRTGVDDRARADHGLSAEDRARAHDRALSDAGIGLDDRCGVRGGQQREASALEAGEHLASLLVVAHRERRPRHARAEELRQIVEGGHDLRVADALTDRRGGPVGDADHLDVRHEPQQARHDAGVSACAHHDNLPSLTAHRSHS